MIVPKEFETKRKKLKDEQWRKLKKLLKVVLATNKFYQNKYAKVGVRSADDIKSWDDFYKLPFTTREELVEDQKEHPPFGINLTQSLDKYFFIHPTSGTTKKELYTFWTQEDLNRMANSIAFDFRTYGVQKGDVFLEMHPRTTAAFINIEGLKKIGAIFIPGVQGDSLMKPHKLTELRVSVLKGSPSGVINLIENAKKEKVVLSEAFVRHVILSGETLFPSVRKIIEKEFQAKCHNWFSSVELRFFALECSLNSSPHLVETDHIFELFDPDNRTKNNSGELIATALFKYDFPLIRYCTGDFIDLDWSECSCGSHSPSIKEGIVKRIGNRLKIGSYFVFQNELENIIRKYCKEKEFQCIVKKEANIDKMEIKIEIPSSNEKIVIQRLLKELKEKFYISPRIISIEPGTLPRSSWKGKRFIDQRFDKEPKQIKKMKQLISWQNLSRRLIRKIIYSLYKERWNDPGIS